MARTKKASRKSTGDSAPRIGNRHWFKQHNRNQTKVSIDSINSSDDSTNSDIEIIESQNKYQKNRKRPLSSISPLPAPIKKKKQRLNGQSVSLNDHKVLVSILYFVNV